VDRKGGVLIGKTEYEWGSERGGGHGRGRRVKKSGGGKGGGEARYDVWCMMVDERGQKRRREGRNEGR
jgi:hypothetical protein